jgi:ABC-2 type transport system ATP-binding protein
MKMLTGYLEPSSGTVTVDGVDVEADPIAVQARLGYLPENLPLYPELSVADYLEYAAALRGVDPAAAVPRAVAATELEEKALEPISTLSRGFKQRVGVAQAILHEPRFLILDEPTNGLDPSQTQHMRQLIQRLAANATVILSTHIMQEVNAICDRALILRGGRLVLDERLADLKSSNTLRLRTHDAADLNALLGADVGATAVTRLAPGVWQLAGSGPLDELAARVTASLVRAEQPVYEVSLVQRDLESVFRQVNEDAREAQHAA